MQSTRGRREGPNGFSISDNLCGEETGTVTLIASASFLCAAFALVLCRVSASA